MNSEPKEQPAAEKPDQDLERVTAPAQSTGDEGITLGEKLRRARALKGISLEQASAATRINLSSLRALEEDNARALPAQVFTRGFVRIYAGYLGLDPNQALHLHIEGRGSGTGADTDDKINIKELLKTEEMAAPPHRVTCSHLFILLLALILGFSAYWGYNNYTRPPDPVEPFLPEIAVYDYPDENAAPPEPEPPFLEKSAEDGETITEEEPVVTHVLVARFSEETWMQIQLDDKPVQEFVFRAGDTRTWTAHEKLELRVGNAGGLELFLNNTPLPPLGRSGQTINLRLP